MSEGEKLSLDAELALQWAYQRELLHHDGLFGLMLPKLSAPAWVKMIDTGAVVDESHEPRFPVGAGEPHPDAIKLDYAVRAVPDVRVELWARRHDLLGDLAPYLSGDDCRVLGDTRSPRVDLAFGRDRRGGKTVSATVRPPETPPVEKSAQTIVMLHARLGNRPVWDIGQPRLVRQRPVMIGRQTGKARYTDGSRCPLQLAPSAGAIAAARFEYAVWHAALVTLSGVRLSTIVILPPGAPARPWAVPDAAVAEARILRSRVTASASRLPLKPQRKPVLAPLESEIEARSRQGTGPVRRVPLTSP